MIYTRVTESSRASVALACLKRDISQVEHTLDDIEANPLKKKTRKRKFREQTNDADITWSGYFKIKKIR